MNVQRDPTADARRKQTIQLFLQRALEEIDEMRRGMAALSSGDARAWQALRMFAQRTADTARSLELGILGACARELAKLTDDQAAGATHDAHFCLLTNSAIEMVAIEINRLIGALDRTR